MPMTRKGFGAADRLMMLAKVVPTDCNGERTGSAVVAAAEKSLTFTEEQTSQSQNIPFSLGKQPLPGGCGERSNQVAKKPRTTTASTCRESTGWQKKSRRKVAGIDRRTHDAETIMPRP
jgi:hypothetical protein